jgi:hypothetical protein
MPLNKDGLRRGRSRVFLLFGYVLTQAFTPQHNRSSQELMSSLNIAARNGAGDGCHGNLDK